jgi:hypothetical protein
MRAVTAVAVAVAAALALAAAGCAGASGDGNSPSPTGLVLELHFDRSDVTEVELSGATLATSRRFGPFVVAVAALPRDSTVGLVFDPSDEGSAMVCGESHDRNGDVLAAGCGTFDVVGAEVTHDSLTLFDGSH